MQLPEYVKCKARMYEYVPWLSGPAYTIYPYIYLPAQVYADLRTEAPTPASLATLAHEQVHLERQARIGIGKYALKYICLGGFRYQEELLAIKAQVLVLHSHGVGFDAKDRARRLSSIEYLWCASFAEARRDIETLLRNTNEDFPKA